MPETTAPAPQPTVYVALRPLIIPNGPGVIPSSLRISKGQRFELDGDEPINLPLLLQSGAVRLWDPSEPVPQVVLSDRDKRRDVRARRAARLGKGGS